MEQTPSPYLIICTAEGMVKENVESDGIEEAVNQRCKLQTPSISGRQKPQLDCDAVEGAHEYGE